MRLEILPMKMPALAQTVSHTWGGTEQDKLYDPPENDV